MFSKGIDLRRGFWWYLEDTSWYLEDTSWYLEDTECCFLFGFGGEAQCFLGKMDFDAYWSGT